jgi:uncharacterized damage-inducible protein DinB
LPSDAALRRHLADLLEHGHAHASAESALRSLRPETRHRRPQPAGHTVWELLEHLRISQEDILQYTLDPAWKSPSWPEGYWPPATKSVGDEAWSASVGRFLADLARVVRLVRDPRVDLTAGIPHAPEHTYLREVLLVADHNAYHVGQIVQARKALGDWPG